MTACELAEMIRLSLNQNSEIVSSIVVIPEGAGRQLGIETTDDELFVVEVTEGSAFIATAVPALPALLKIVWRGLIDANNGCGTHEDIQAALESAGYECPAELEEYGS